MTTQDVLHKIEWANKRCSLVGQPLTELQVMYLKFVFSADGDSLDSGEPASDRTPEGSWVRSKTNGVVRYITTHVNDKCFHDDGKMSKQDPSSSCLYENYFEI